jgi:Tfp pilus assembly protein PilE
MLLVFQRKSDERGRSWAFTLVELLVVVAITAIMAALLLPALLGAREKSSRAVCKSNLREVLLGLQMYADDYSAALPSSADNAGDYHAVRLSDATFTNFVTRYLGGVSNVFYCPNVDYDGMATHDKYGYIIGYNYLVMSVTPTTKGPDFWQGLAKLQGSTNELIADANYWTQQPVGSAAVGIQLAPHTATGASFMTATATVRVTGPTAPAAPTSVSLGAQGGNIGRADGSVTWKPIQYMGEHQASLDGDADGNW